MVLPDVTCPSNRVWLQEWAGPFITPGQLMLCRNASHDISELYYSYKTCIFSFSRSPIFLVFEIYLCITCCSCNCKIGFYKTGMKRINIPNPPSACYQRVIQFSPERFGLSATSSSRCNHLHLLGKRLSSQLSLFVNWLANTLLADFLADSWPVIRRLNNFFSPNIYN